MTTSKPHPLVGDPPDTSTPTAHRLAREAYERAEDNFFAEHYPVLFWAHMAGAKLRKQGAKFILAIEPPREALEFLARYEQDKHPGHHDGVVAEGTWGDMLGDIGPGYPELPRRPDTPDTDYLATELLELAASDPNGKQNGQLVGFTTDAEGLVVHAPFGDVPLGHHARLALAARGWPDAINAARQAVASFPRAVTPHKLAMNHARAVDLQARNRLIVALCDEAVRAEWFASLRARIEVVDATTLGELGSSDRAIAIWALCTTPNRLRLALASQPR